MPFGVKDSSCHLTLKKAKVNTNMVLKYIIISNENTLISQQQKPASIGVEQFVRAESKMLLVIKNIMQEI